MEIFKVEFSWVEESPSGGPWMAKSEIKVYDAETAKAMGIKEKTLRRAKEDLKKDERIKIFSQGFRPKKWYAVRISPDDKG